MAKVFEKSSVVLELSLTEAAALSALLCRINNDTNEGVNQTLYDLWENLEAFREHHLTVFPSDFDVFANNQEPLIDPSKETV